MALVLPAWGVGGLGSASAQTIETANSRRFSAAEQNAIARAFAPRLVFHAEERYFPISSMFLLPLAGVGEADSTLTSRTPDQLGSAEERAAKYVQLSQQEKLARAAVGYRVFSRFKRGQTEVIVEYWCHYVYNEFTIRGTWLPYRISGNHLQDLERLFLVLAPSSDAPLHADVVDEAWARQTFHIERIVANAHDGSVPPNEYDVRHGKPVEPPVTILVEHGSHAMAPDINHDGRFTPAEDSTTTNKLLWGIRDGGRPWGWYRKSQMDERNPGRTVRLCVSSLTVTRDGDCGPYNLYPIENLQRWFDDLNLSAEDRREVLGHSSWFTRPFGAVKVEDLLVPKDPPDGSVLDRMLRRHHRSSQGAVAGYGTLNNGSAFVVGGRYFNDVPSLKWPDFVAEGFAMVQDDQHVNVKVSAFGSYALDATTSVVLGVDWIANARRPSDVVAGVEFRVGRLLVRPSWRLREGVYDTLVVAIF
jgi:hypothetical protein